MSQITLTYFDTAGRGEPLRIVLNAANIDFEDKRISFKEFATLVPELPMGAVPIIEIDGTHYTQSNGLMRFYGKQAGLYPEDAWEAYKCDEVMGLTEDMTNKMVATFGLKDDALVAARDKLIKGPMTQFLSLLDARLEAAGGQYMANNALTVADLKVTSQLQTFASGFLEHVPTDIVSQIAPRMQAYLERIAKEPVVTNYYGKS